MSTTEQTLIDKYEIISTLGRGSMGVVYKARDPEIGRIVAIKTLRSVYLGDDPAGNEALQRFRQESRSAGRLRHPNIVTIFETGRTENGSPFIVMEFVEGQSLEAMIAERAPLDPLETLHYFGQIGSAIDYAHSQNVIHRDIKPSNVIIDSYHRPLLLDFGVAKLSDTSLTPAGTVVGTPSYMSPEQIRGEKLDGATDRFAFAVMAYEALTGSRPFAGADFTSVVTNIIHKPPRSFAEVGATHLAGELERVVEKALAKERAERYPSCGEFVDAIGRVFGVVVDGAGVPGYRKNMKLSDIPASGVTETTRNEAFSDERTDAPSDKIDRAAESESLAYLATAATNPVGPVAERRSSAVYLVLLVVLVCGLAALFLPRGYLGEDEVRGVFDTLTQRISPFVAEEPSSEAATEEPQTAETQGEQEILPEEGAVASDPYAILRKADTAPELLEAAIGEAAKGEYEQVAPVLIELSKHENYRVRIAVMKAFASSDRFKTKEVFRAIVDRFNDDQYLVRGYAVKMLAALGNEAALHFLEEHRKVETNETVLKVLDESIERIRSTRQ